MLPRCIVIGASAGGYPIVVDIVSQLPSDLSVPVFVVIHIPPYERNYLAEILTRAGHLPAINPSDGTAIQSGFIYIALPDHHMLIDKERIAVKRGPKENGFRPSIDALFRSAAYSYGPGAIGVVLSGALNDGASGLWSIKRLGGIAIVQDPYEAKYPSMPRSALQYIEADYKVRSTEIAPLLTRLVGNEPNVQSMQKESTLDEEITRIAKEVQIAAGTNLPEKTILELGELTQFTCPECRGALVRISEGNMFRFRCHTGHGFSSDSLLEEIMQVVGELIWQTQRGFQEASMLLEHMGHHMLEQGESAKARVFLSKALELNQRASAFQRIAVGHESLSEENIEEHQPSESEADD